ncbi:MAG: hypothetical protein WBB73_11700 [Candidatus Aminicenantaceae bacterium]
MNKKHTGVLLGFVICLFVSVAIAQEEKPVFPGAHERTPSLSQYFSWINNTNEGSTERQTLVNLDFFQWLKEEYGMRLDIYVISAGAIDKARWYGSMDSPEFSRQFPNGFEVIFRKAEAMGTRLGTWGGPDGFGNTQEEEQARIDMMVALCRDYRFRLLKFDAVVGQLRDEKQDAFIRMMTECRRYSPDLILLNHRLNLNQEAKRHVTTSLWEGAETYIDVHMFNRGVTAPHHRAGALSRDLVPGLKRLTEDHGVCLSSCLDYWEDDLILQAFNRSLLLSPQLYGNPWFLRDEEYPKLARIFNLAHKYREIMVEGIVLPESRYGAKAVSRGDGDTRLITLRNLAWEPFEATLKLDEEIGLDSRAELEVRLLHPVERIVGVFRKGNEIPITVEPFRSALVLVTPYGRGGIGIMGCDYDVIRAVPGKPVEIAVKGMPGTAHSIRLQPGGGRFSRAVLDGKETPELLEGKAVRVSFPGVPLAEAYHRKLADLDPVSIPADAEALYEATMFAADNNALEVRSLLRSGETNISEVKAARESFLKQELFVDRGLWDRYMFDEDLNTAFYLSRRWSAFSAINRGSLRLDFGAPTSMDELVINVGSEHALQPWKTEEALFLETSSDLVDWKAQKILAGKVMRIKLDPSSPIRYVRFRGFPERILEVDGFLEGKPLERSKWRGSHLFSPFSRIKVFRAWESSFKLSQIPRGSYLAIALEGKHGVEGAYAAVRVDGKPVGAPDRSPSYPGNPWENTIDNAASHYTYYVPLDEDMIDRKIDVVVLGLDEDHLDFKPSVYITAYPPPYVAKQLLLYR